MKPLPQIALILAVGIALGVLGTYFTAHRYTWLRGESDLYVWRCNNWTGAVEIMDGSAQPATRANQGAAK